MVEQSRIFTKVDSTMAICYELESSPFDTENTESGRFPSRALSNEVGA